MRQAWAKLFYGGERVRKMNMLFSHSLHGLPLPLRQWFSPLRSQLCCCAESCRRACRANDCAETQTERDQEKEEEEVAAGRQCEGARLFISGVSGGRRCQQKEGNYPLSLKKVKGKAEDRKEVGKEGEKEGGRGVRRGSSRHRSLLKRSKISSPLHSVIHRLPSILSFSTVEERSGGRPGSPPSLSQWSSTERR